MGGMEEETSECHRKTQDEQGEKKIWKIPLKVEQFLVSILYG